MATRANWLESRHDSQSAYRMSTASEAVHIILNRLDQVECERQQRLAVPGLGARVSAIKSYQQRRFAQTYADLLRSQRYGAATRFFLDELYGPTDFTQRDAQFARVVPALVRMFPEEIVGTVVTLSELHALSEALDTRMARHLDATNVTSSSYVKCWQAASEPADRADQIRLTVEIAEQLDRLTQKALLRNALRLMRGPARIAGLAELQRFLENGFDTFRAMRGAAEFIAIITLRERAFAQAIFSASDVVGKGNDGDHALESKLPPDGIA